MGEVNGGQGVGVMEGEGGEGVGEGEMLLDVDSASIGRWLLAQQVDQTLMLSSRADG